MSNKRKVEITLEELTHLNKFILHVVDVEDFTKRVEDRISEVILNNPFDYVNEDMIIDMDTEIDVAIEHVWESDYEGIFTPTIIYEQVHEKISSKELDNITIEAVDIVKDQRELERNPLGYHGMSERDFL